MAIRTRRLFAILCVTVAIGLTCLEVHSQDLNTVLMNGTYEIYGPSASVLGSTTFGTVFFMGKPQKADPEKGYFVLITAAHVLNEISGDTATLVLRKKDADGIFNKSPIPISIRSKGSNLYKTNPDPDVAVMYLSIPIGMEPMLLPIGFLADDARLEQLEVHPGDELLCLGFPLAIDINGFPVVRSGLLASYPITPSRTVKRFYYNFHIFPGNSGGPVYFSFSGRTYGNAMRVGQEQGVIGLVSQQVTSNLPEFKDAPLDVSIVVPSLYITDTIASLPDAPDAP